MASPFRNGDTRYRVTLCYNDPNMAKRAVVPRSEYEYPKEVRAEAVALALSSRSYAEAAREMAKRYPERSPSRELIRYWTKQLDPENFRLLSQERQEELIDRIHDLALLSADKLEAEIEAGNIKAQQLAITYGISADKALRLREVERRHGGEPHIGPIMIVVEDPPDVIEGEAKELPEDGREG